MIKLLDGLPDGVVGLEAVGDVEDDDYRDVIVPAIEAALEGRDKIRLLYVLGPEFDEFEGDAAWEDAKLGMHHLFDFERVGVVTDVKWMARSIRWFGFAIPGEAKVFRYADLEGARAWITEGV
jgi:SpoIIAA-like